MIKKVYQSIMSFIAVNVLFWVKPELKKIVRSFLICTLFIVLIIYLQSEYLKWSEISGNREYLNLSFILKYVLILLSLIILIFSIKRSKLKHDGFDKFRDKKLKTVAEKKFKPQENSTTSEIDDAYFDRFRTKKKLRTTREIKLGKE